MIIPQNSLTDKIRIIVDIYENHKNELGGFEFLPPASDKEIFEWENINNITLPESYKDWLKFSNGTTIDMTTAEFFSLDHIEKFMKIYSLPDEYVMIGSMIGDGEDLLFSKKNAKIVWHDHGQYREYNNMNEILDVVINMLNDNFETSDIISNLLTKFTEHH